ncbi:hypothetical protein DY000_02033180 [Brassica cretica]|uniref:Uncharacterized protein n=1 Tax=Brassica cretica TaxID=69181 RepID=A0ABQ7DXQ2_BRACR|nr:hypothetical protein DY000_02033180 [Brassica cretica]
MGDFVTRVDTPRFKFGTMHAGTDFGRYNVVDELEILKRSTMNPLVLGATSGSCTGTPTWCRLTYRVRWGDGYGSGTPGKRTQHVFCPSSLLIFISHSPATLSFIKSLGMIMLPCLRKLLLMRRCIKSATSWILRKIGNRSLMLWLLSSIYSWDNNLGEDMPGATCVSCICSKRHKLSETDQATGSCGVHLLKQQELRNTRAGAQKRSHMFQQQRGSLRRNPKHICLR